jgi:hypothetical protein
MQVRRDLLVPGFSIRDFNPEEQLWYSIAVTGVPPVKNMAMLM